MAAAVVRHEVEEGFGDEVAEVAEAEEAVDEGAKVGDLRQYARRRMTSMNTSTHRHAPHVHQLINNQGR